jgi:hypothetical protein
MNVGTQFTTLHTKEGQIFMSAAEMLVRFRRMEPEGYKDYLLAHGQWLAIVATTRTRMHDEAVVRHHLTTVHETVTRVDGNPNRTVPFGSRDYVVSSAKKTEHAPTLSVKPHRAAKRAAKVQLTNAKAKASAEILDSRSALVSELVPEKKASISGVAKIRVGANLSYARVAAAKVATAHATVINRGSKDIVANILPDENWKIVTRKKGDFKPSLTEVKRTETGSEDTFSVSADPTVPQSLVLKQAVRQMNISG